MLDAYIAVAKQSSKLKLEYDYDTIDNNLRNGYILKYKNRKMNSLFSKIIKIIKSKKIKVVKRGERIFINFNDEEIEEVIKTIFMVRSNKGRFTNNDLNAIKIDIYGVEGTKEQLFELFHSQEKNIDEHLRLQELLSAKDITWNIKKKKFNLTDVEIKIINEWGKPLPE